MQPSRAYFSLCEFCIKELALQLVFVKKMLLPAGVSKSAAHTVLLELYFKLTKE
jgi:hypothetical protein